MGRNVPCVTRGSQGSNVSGLVPSPGHSPPSPVPWSRSTDSQAQGGHVGTLRAPVLHEDERKYMEATTSGSQLGKGWVSPWMLSFSGRLLRGGSHQPRDWELSHGSSYRAEFLGWW